MSRGLGAMKKTQGTSAQNSSYRLKAKFEWFKWQKKLVHSFYYILYQPKGVPSSSHNFSGSGGMYGMYTFIVVALQHKTFLDN